MRIAHVISTPTGIGGAERVLAALVSEGLRRGLVQRVFNPFGRPGSPLQELCGDVPVEAREASLTGVWALRKWLRGRLLDFDPAIVHVHLFHAAALVASIPRAGEVRVLTHHHGDVFELRGQRFFRQLDRWSCKRFDYVVAVSGSVQEFLASRYRCPKVTVIHNGWVGSPRPRERRSGPEMILSISHLRPEKGHSTLIDAFCQVRTHFPQCRLAIVGDGPLRETLEHRAEAAGVRSAVEFSGEVSDVWSYLARADVFVLVSSNEPFGVAALEALAAGVPVVVSETGGFREFVDEQVGVFVPPGDPDALELALVKLLSDPHLRRSMGDKGVIRARTFTMDATADRYIKLYEKSLSNA